MPEEKQLKINPIGNRVAIKPSKEEEITKSGIILPNKGKEKSEEGVVVAIGSETSEVKVKDKIVFKSFAVDEIKLNKETIFIVSEKDILGIIK